MVSFTVLSVPAMRCCTHMGIAHWKHHDSSRAQARGAGFDATTGSGARASRVRLGRKPTISSMSPALSPDRRSSTGRCFALCRRTIGLFGPCPWRTSFLSGLALLGAPAQVPPEAAEREKRDAAGRRNKDFSNVPQARPRISASGAAMGPGLMQKAEPGRLLFQRQGQRDDGALFSSSPIEVLFEKAESHPDPPVKAPWAVFPREKEIIAVEHRQGPPWNLLPRPSAWNLFRERSQKRTAGPAVMPVLLRELPPRPGSGPPKWNPLRDRVSVNL